ncbi:metallophosphoesterase family protein [Anaerolinea thermophila]|nr:metallophosphoesterase [Anaerolinea thermophila]
MPRQFWLWLFLFFLALAGCAPQGAVPVVPSASPLLPSMTFPPSDTPSPTLTASPSPTATLTPTFTPTPTPAVLAGAGDISICGQDGDDQTAQLLMNLPGEVFTAGDNSNEQGKPIQYRQCFDASWGRLMSRLHPAPGNHDYGTDEGAPYFAYFGERAGPPGRGYYSYELGAWHILALNSNCEYAGGCGADSEQERWLREDLLSHPNRCTLAYWHHPRWSSGWHGSDARTDAFWRALYDFGAEVVVSGHDHHYERFAPQSPEGERDDLRGIRQFIAGTGGVSLRGYEEIHPLSEVRYNDTFGVLVFILYPDRYEWQFLSVDGARVIDSGSDECHP